MDNELAKWAYDALRAATRIQDFVAGKEYDDFRSDILLTSAVER